MDEVKRKLSSDDSSEEKTKKFRNEFDQSMTCFEDLSNELLCEIFDYLNGYGLHKAFSNLNSRFEQLLHSSCVLFKTHFCLLKNDEVMNMFKQFLFPNRHQIFSIYVTFILQHSYFFSSVLFDSSFNRLESIFFKDIQSNTLIPVLGNLSSLPRLFSLTINTWKVFDRINDIYRLIFALPLLKYNKFMLHLKDSSIILPIAGDQQFGRIEYLVIDHSCTLNELVCLISYTPQLRRLTLHNTKMNDSNIKILSSITLANLKSIYLNVCQTTFNELEIFITKISPNLKSLSIIGSEDITFLDAHRWEKLILHNFPQLEKFYLICYDRRDNDNQYPIYSGQANQFSSSFWIQRKLIFDVEIKFTYIGYIIRPYSKRWYEETKENIGNYSVEHSAFINLIFECIPNCMFQEVVPKEINRVLKITKIYHLEIFQKKISISALIDVVNILPDIITLKLHSLSTDETTTLPVEKFLILCAVKETNKITKAYLEQIDDVQELDFLFTFCPYMGYFKVGYIKTTDVQFFLRTILKKINHNNDYHHHLRSLCFDVPTADHQIVKNIEEMIKCEKLLAHFAVKRILDSIYLQWK